LLHTSPQSNPYKSPSPSNFEGELRGPGTRTARQLEAWHYCGTRVDSTNHATVPRDL